MENALAKQMAHTYTGDANAIGPLATGIKNYLSKFGPGYWEGVKGDIDTGMRNQLARSIMAVAQHSPEMQNKLGITPTRGESRNAIMDYMAAMPMNTESLSGPMGAFAGMIAYHGSPHKFDKFKLDKIGTGEGAQAYGHGLYFAENPAVAREYAKMNPMKTPPPNRLFRGSELVPGTPEYHAGTLLEHSSLAKARKDVAKWIAEGSPDKELVDGWKKTLDTLNQATSKADFKVVKSNNLYKVDISDDAVKNFLDWDKPLSQQPDVLKAITPESMGLQLRHGENGYMAFVNAKNRPIGTMQKGGTVESFRERWAKDLTQGDKNGSDLYKWLGLTQAEASEALRTAGIPGIRYLDQGSREAGKGSSNFVVFDEDIVKVLERN